jgi:hypothetical protein
LTHILEEYKRRFLQNTHLFINRFELENHIEFNHTIPNGATQPMVSEMRDEVILTVELETRFSRPSFNELGDETFRLVSMATYVEPLFPRNIGTYGINNRYILKLKYFIIKN